MVVPGVSEPNGTSCQPVPPAVESSASGVVMPALVVSVPMATTRFPLIATSSTLPLNTSAATGSSRVVQARPSAVVHTTGAGASAGGGGGGPRGVAHTRGRPSREPADTKPSGPAATASTTLEPVTGFTSSASVQLVRFDDQ